MSTNAVSSMPEASERFTEYLRRKADEAEQKADTFAGSTYYPPEWWRTVARSHRDLADDFDRIEGVLS